jgi:nitrogen-specific signal transduction histidine kinase/ActR/RegA family two-component response regulator
VRDLEGNISSLALVFRDVTLELERGRQLVQAQKMDSLGALAGGVAHDFNNILSAILTTAELIEWQLEPDSPIRPRLEIIYQVSQQARELNRQILSFSRRSEEKLIPFDLSHVLREALTLLKATLPRTILLGKELAPSIWVAGDPAQIHQVVMNLAINGCHAIGDQEGHLTVTLDERELAEDDGLPLSAGRYAELCVRDTGSGMDPLLLERIFEPFFTTKGAGTGTGLGLSVVHGIVQGHGGHILVESVPGQGSAFRVFIPCTQARSAVPAVDRAGEIRGSERILLVDDEDIVTALSKQGLEALGYHVVAKTSPTDALEVFQARPGAFDLLITDLALPGFSGTELIRRIRRIRPGMPAILVTGTHHAVESMPSLAVTFDETLAKPLAPKDLGASIRRVLDTRKLLDTQDLAFGTP